jgi:hypothetical protein
MCFLLIGQGFDPWRWAFGSQGASERGRCAHDATRHPCLVSKQQKEKIDRPVASSRWASRSSTAVCKEACTTMPTVITKSRRCSRLRMTCVQFSRCRLAAERKCGAELEIGSCTLTCRALNLQDGTSHRRRHQLIHGVAVSPRRCANTGPTWPMSR